MFLEVLTGFAGGAADQVVEISKDKRKELAEKLRREAQAEINRVHQERGFGQQKELEGMRSGARSELEETRYKHEGLLNKQRSELRSKEGEKEFLRKKESGAFDRGPTILSPGQVAVDRGGKEIARGVEKSTNEKDTRTTDEKNYERFLSENPEYNGDFMQWREAWKSSDKTKMAYDMAQNDMRVMKSPESIHEVAKEYLNILGGKDNSETPSLNIMDLVEKGRALRGMK
jgi:hypothetical protein